MNAQTPDAGNRFDRGRHTLQALEGAQAHRINKITGHTCAMGIFQYLCRWMKSDAPLVDQSNGQIRDAIGLHRNTVRETLHAMVKAGFLTVVSGQKGGRMAGPFGRATVYRINVLPSEIGEKMANQGVRKTDNKGSEKSASRGQENLPPNRNNKNKGERDGAAQGGGSTMRHLDAAQERGPVAGDERQTATPEERRAIAASLGLPIWKPEQEGA